MTLSVSNLGIDGLEDVEQIGTGGSSRVYRARQADLDRIVAVKVLNPGHDQGVTKRFDRERKAMGRLSLHEGIVPVYSSGTTTHGEPYLVMPYYANGSLQDQINTGAMEWQTAVSYVDVAAETIAAAHDEGVVHLDLKPANILLTNQGAPRIADFGIAKLTTGQGASAGTTGGAAFTPAYSAPETFLDGETGPPSDVYGLGATLWALLVGHPPFLTPGDDTNLMAVIGRVVNNPVGDLRHFTPAAICDVIERAMAKEPEDRYQTAREFSLALKTAAAGASPDFEPVSEEPKGTILFPGPPPGSGSAGPAGSRSSETQMVTRMDPVELPPSIASSPGTPSSAPPARPLLQETAQSLPKPAGGPPPVSATPFLDLDRFRFGPILFGVLAFLGVIGVAFWALNRSPDTEATDGPGVDDRVNVTQPASPGVDSSSNQSSTASSAGGGTGDDGDGTTSSNPPTSSGSNPASTIAAGSSTTTTEASTSTTEPATSTTGESTTTSGDTTTTTSGDTTTTSGDTTTTSGDTTTTTSGDTTTTTSGDTTTTTEAATTTTEAATTTTEIAPSANITAISPSATSLAVTFTSDQCIARYRLSATDPDDNAAVASDDLTGLTCRNTLTATLTGLTEGTSYDLRLTVYNTGGRFDQDTGRGSTAG
ncbi:MAG: protein kinase domain-containing protein [Acidimicrobiales bacterium]